MAVIGAKIKEDLFGDEPAIGREIKINGQRYEVVGVMAEKRMFDDDWGNRVLLPFTTVAKRLIGNDYLQVLFVYTRGAQYAVAGQVDQYREFAPIHAVSGYALQDFIHMFNRPSNIPLIKSQARQSGQIIQSQDFLA